MTIYSSLSKNSIRLLSCSIVGLMLGACGGGSGSGSSDSAGIDVGGSSTASKSDFTLQVTDAPIDGMVAVVLQFTEVGVRQTDGTWINFPLATPKSVDLLQLQGTRTMDLLSEKQLPVGRYDEVRLLLDDAPMTNYVDLGAGGLAELKVPGGASSGLKIKGDFMLFSSEPTTIVVDFDLRQSIRSAGKTGKYLLQPVLRVVDANKVGHLRDQVSAMRLSSPAKCSDNDVDTHNAVYLYAGHDVIPADIDQSSDLDVDPIATATINYVPMKGAYEYEAAFLPEGDYTLAMTCNADLDDLDRGGDDLRFFIVRNVTVTVM